MIKKKLSPLEREWEKKLKDSGFNDVENAERGFWYERKRKRFLCATYDITYEYFRLAGFFLHDHKFKDERDKLVWTHHNDGLTLQAVTDKLKESGYSISKSTVENIINRLAKTMVDTYDERL